MVANKSLNFIVRLKGSDAFGRSNEIAIVRAARPAARDPHSARAAGKESIFVLLSSVIRAHLADLFPGRELGEFSQFRVTRHSELAVDEEDVSNLRTALRQGLTQRNYGQSVRLEVSASCTRFLSDFLQAQFSLPAQAVFRVHGPVNLCAWASSSIWPNARRCFPPGAPPGRKGWCRAIPSWRNCAAMMC
jgi:polyphosphate kinase